MRKFNVLIYSLIILISIFHITSIQAQEFKTFNYGQAISQGQSIAQRNLELQRQQEELRILRLQREQIEQERQLFKEERQRQKKGPRTENERNIHAKFQEAIKYRKYRFDDFDEVIRTDNVPISYDMISLMIESKYAADIVYYLCKHPDESARIFDMPLPEAGKAIYTIEKKISKNLE